VFVRSLVPLSQQLPWHHRGMQSQGAHRARAPGQVLERILAVDFRFPGSIPVSADCKDLLTRILVADPAKRASIEDIQQHPWCARLRPQLAPSICCWGRACGPL